jgi:hypothetical protein
MLGVMEMLLLSMLLRVLLLLRVMDMLGGR